MASTLEVCTRNFERARSGVFRYWVTLQFRIPPPRFLLKDPSDDLWLLFNNLDTLCRKGTVVWGALVQANQLLFETKYPGGCPGDMVYSLEDPMSVSPNELREIAKRLFRLKGAESDNLDDEFFGSHLANELTRAFGLKVPRHISAGLPCKMSTTFFHRPHLPGRKISFGIIPLVASQEEPYLVLPLPQKYWDREFKRKWLQFGSRAKADPTKSPAQDSTPAT